jgi:putative transposase
MPRQSRIDAPGALHHVIIRGIERRRIFRDDKDREAFLDRLGDILLSTSTPCYAWALIPNHAHLLLRTGTIPIASIMRRVLTGYAVTFNRRYRRHGQLFQNRYKSVLCEEDPYLLQLVRYIHLNPLRAGLVEDLKELASYRFSGHSVLMGKVQRLWQDGGYILNFFGERESKARKGYASYIREGVKQGRKPELVGGGMLRSVGGWRELKGLRDQGIRVKGDERILGGSDFVEQVLREAEEGYEKRTLLKRRGMDLRKLMEKVAGYYAMEVEDLRSGSRVRKVARARAILCYLGVRRLGITCARLADELKISPSGVSRAIERGHEIVLEKDIEERILKSK